MFVWENGFDIITYTLPSSSISVLDSHPFSLQVATILCLLLNLSSLLLLSILAADGVPSHQGGSL